ncbi:DUF4331 family protein [Sphingomicrobium sediminis]|uniref:DUF4331 domain-containing protein n=1 Tax=Sphingomicrobium sediminis TaxID=2950949 RepID=A0A9X2EEW0_9SPHN|nr:DUF4331 family protein [Sphingomicrobium sediminis]MCM8556653.1 DUF4331 domain-containing protein [Sphingomicrobium sediminis]
MTARKIILGLTPALLAVAVAGCENNNQMAMDPPIADDGDMGGDMGGDMASFDVTPCLTQEIPGTGVTVAEAVVPDTLTVDYRSPSGFPNGRALADPVIDVTLAVIFLDLATNGPATLAGLPLNPPENDVAFRSDFPYLAAAQGTPPASDTSGTTFTFEMSDDSAYARVDRMGMPAVSTALIPTESKVPYNDAAPEDDADGVFVDDITMVLTGLTEALADDLVGAGLTPCATSS